MTMTKYEPKTDDGRRSRAETYAHCAALCGQGTIMHEIDVAYILQDLTHAEACLRERDTEIERLNKRLVEALKIIAALDGHCLELYARIKSHAQPAPDAGIGAVDTLTK